MSLVSTHRRGARHLRRSIVAAAAIAVVAALAACGGSGASPAPSASSAVAVSDAWARPAPAGGETAIYLTLTNPGAGADALTAASSAVAASVELHETTTDMNGMTGMDPTERIEVPAGGTVSLTPGGKHLMVSGLTKALDPGASIDVDLVFEHAGTVHVTAEVRQP
jgi:copper(I)-binding protein